MPRSRRMVAHVRTQGNTLSPIRAIGLIAIAAGGMIVCAWLAYRVNWIFVLGVPGAAITAVAIAIATDGDKQERK